ncbi:predicted protein [Nematostella vectensis]|uniref:ATP synthase subunit d, mitochondrial n=1 Tax=Nematostella vectensis TaxID=45351 RepID=A7SNG9_NEMVE|nr:ATP synthase subunit d, mitochondrial [Nematostella vectensis]EDO34731.1 predicted protein [Nematostella vectensis]|eukprot:XP_001626831.1 predicted protein [Nematostella vectensis]
MAARRIGQYVPDWVKIASRVPAEGRADMARFRSIYDNLKSGLDSVPAKAETIDWAFYQKNISKPGMVESFRKAYEAITVPYPKDTQTAKIDVVEKEMAQECEKLMRESRMRIKEYQAEMEKIKSQKSFEDMTVDEYLEMHPELKKQADEEIKKHIWN